MTIDCCCFSTPTMVSWSVVCWLVEIQRTDRCATRLRSCLQDRSLVRWVGDWISSVRVAVCLCDLRVFVVLVYFIKYITVRCSAGYFLGAVLHLVLCAFLMQLSFFFRRGTGLIVFGGGIVHLPLHGPVGRSIC